MVLKHLDRALYYGLAVLTRVLHSANIIDKNHLLFRKKRQYLLKIIPDSKLIAEIAAVAHSLYHPKKDKRFVDSIKNHLKTLLDEAKKRKLTNDTMVWAEKMLNKKYKISPKREPAKWKPDLMQLDTYFGFAKKRTTVRYVSDTKFEKKLIDRLIECAVEAPSSCNRQSWRFFIFEDKKIIEEIARIKQQPFIKDFPYVVACCFDKEVYMGTDGEMTPYLDCGAALLNLTNAATALGLASCWCNFTLRNVGRSKHEQFRRLVDLPRKYVPVSFVALGVAAEIFPKPPRENVKFYLP